MNAKDDKKLKVLFLYNNERSSVYEEVLAGKNHGVGFWGMVHLRDEGFETDFCEVEKVFSSRIASWFRRHINVYFVHIPCFFKMFRYDFVFTSGGFGLQLLHALYPFKKPKWIMHDFNISNFIGDKITLRQKIFYWMTSRCDGIVTLGMEETELLKKMFPHLESKIQMIPFGVDTKLFRPLNLEKVNTVIGVGRDPDRDWDLLVDAAPSIGAEVIIATRDSRVAHLQPLPGNVTAKHFDIEEFRPVLDSAKVFILPMNTKNKTNETMGCSALYEAMAAGKAIVATRTKTIESYIEHGKNGFLIDDGNKVQLIDYVNQLLSNPSLVAQFEKNARTYAEEKLDIGVVTKQLASYFSSLGGS